VVEWFDRDKDVPIRFAEVPKAVRWFLYLALLSVIFYRGYFSGREFIYFQF
jgi:hypothetical protein